MILDKRKIWKLLSLGACLVCLYRFFPSSHRDKRAKKEQSEDSVTCLEAELPPDRPPGDGKSSDYALNPDITLEDDVFPFEPMLTPVDLCQGPLDLLVFVHSKPSHLEHRLFIRKTWGSTAHEQNHEETLKVIFVMGTTDDDNLQAMLELEHAQYEDILQTDFVDTYRNLTYKYLTGLNYVLETCDQVPYILKTDDDMFVNMFALWKVIKGLPSTPCHGLILCDLIKQPYTQRDQSNKWYISERNWPTEHYPAYCPGTAVLMAADAARLLAATASKVPFFWIDDVYVTGILAEVAGVQRQELHSYHTNIKELEEGYASDINREKEFIFCHSKEFDRMEEMWQKLLKYYTGTNRYEIFIS